MAFNIDIATHFLADDHQVFVLHPGAQKKFYKEFFAQKKVFLDIPGAELVDPLDIGGNSLHAMLKMSKAIAKWHLNGAVPDKEPSRDIKKHLKKGRINHKTKLASEVEGLYINAKKGDLVVCPGPGYVSPVLIGEFVDEPSKRISAKSAKYPNETIPARRVNWISSNRIKAIFSERLIELMQNRQALIRLFDLDERKEIYDVAYKEYSIGNSAIGQIQIKSESIDLRELSKGSDVIFYFSSMFNALEGGNSEDFLKLDFSSAIDKYYNVDQFIDTSISINSPGFISLEAREILLPPFLGIMLALSAYGLSPDEVVAAEFINSSSGTVTECNVGVSDKIRQTMDMMHLDLWEEICEKRQAATDSLGMDNSVKISEQEPKQKTKQKTKKKPLVVRN